MVPRSLAVGVLLACLGPLTAIGPGAAAASVETKGTAPAEAAALDVRLNLLAPAYLPRRGNVRVSGTVTNADDVTWTSIDLYPFFGAGAPITSRTQLAQAGQSDPLLEVGPRITSVAEDIGTLAPGEASTFTLDVPVEALGTAGPGVYWFGVHAMGESEEQGRDLVADGRARTWLPYVPRGRRDPDRVPGRIKTAMVVPLRRYLPYGANGALDRLPQWTRTLGDSGRLRALVDFGSASDGNPVTWLVDPALFDVVRRLADGNPPRSLGPSTKAGDGQPSTSGSAGTGAQASEPSPRTGVAAEAAKAWLENAQPVLEDGEVLALPYGDLDVEAAAADHADFYRAARERTGTLLSTWDVTPRPAIESTSTFLNPGVLDLLDADDDSEVLMTEEMFGDEPPGVADVDGRKVGVISSGVIAGGPAPGDQFTSLQVRQRMLGEAAVRLLGDGRQPLISVMPRQWDGERPTSFFSGLDTVDWLDLTTYADATSRDGRSIPAGRLAYPEPMMEQWLSTRRLDAATELIDAGSSLQTMLSRNAVVANEVTDQALASPSYGARFAPRRSAQSLESTLETIRRQLGSVTIDAGRGVTLSSSTGSFAVALRNRLDQAVTVRIEARSGSGVEITPPEPVELRAGARTSVVLDAHARNVGVHNVTLLLTDVEGNPLGSVDVVSVRSSQVSGMIWLVLGVGCGLLFLAILVRLVRRIRHARRGTDTTDDGDGEDDVGAGGVASADPVRPLESS